MAVIQIIYCVILANLNGIVFSKTVLYKDSQLGEVAHLMQKRQAGEITHKFGFEKMWKVPLMLPFLNKFKLPTIFEEKKEEEKAEENKQEEGISNHLYTDISKSLQVKAFLDSVAAHVPLKKEEVEGKEEHKVEEKEDHEVVEEVPKKEEKEPPKYIPPWSYGTRWALYLGNVLVSTMSSLLEGTKSAFEHYSKPPEII